MDDSELINKAQTELMMAEISTTYRMDTVVIRMLLNRFQDVTL